MSNELKILFSNIKNLRRVVINEAAGEGSLRDAIENHKIIYIYYNGDEIMQKGYRTVRPFVLGSHKESGNQVMRAWQDAGSSASYRNIPTNSRWGHRHQKGHEYFDNPKGSGTQPGWRLFRVDKITSILPTGEKFDPREFFNVSGIDYNPDDKDINVQIAIQKDVSPDTQIGGTDSITEPDKTATKIPSSAFDKQAPKFKQFFNLAKKTRQATKDEIENLWDVVKRQRKKSPKNYTVVQNEKGDMVLVTNKAVERGDVPDESIVGNLNSLYDKLVLSKKPPESTDYYNKVEKDTIRDIKKRKG